MGDKVVVGLGSTGGCKGRSDVGGVIKEGERERGGQKEWYGKIPNGVGNGEGKRPGRRRGGWLKGNGKKGGKGGKGVG